MAHLLMWDMVHLLHLAHLAHLDLLEKNTRASMESDIRASMKLRRAKTYLVTIIVRRHHRLVAEALLVSLQCRGAEAAVVVRLEPHEGIGGCVVAR